MEWKTTHGLTTYPDALTAMKARVEGIQQGTADELVWLVEHPPLYTLGTSAKAADVLGTAIPTYETGRGGQVTYHGPGQRVAYVMRDLKKHASAAGPDLRAYVKDLEHWIILTLAQFGIEGFLREGRVGVWVEEGVTRGGWRVAGEGNTSSVVPPPPRGRLGGGAVENEAPDNSRPPIQPSPARGEGFSTPTHEVKIAALGVRVQKWVTSHGIALNVNPDLSHYAGIVPCGIREFGVTSLHLLGVTVGMDEVDAVLKETWGAVFDK